MVEARHFNSLEFKPNSVAKYSPFHILDGEAYWYQHAPSAAQKHIPAMISCKIQVRFGALDRFTSSDTRNHPSQKIRISGPRF